MIRQGGLFIACAGVGLIAGAVAARLTGYAEPVLRPAFFIGVALGVVAMLGPGRRMSLGRPTRFQRRALWFGLGLEGLLFAVLPAALGRVDPGTYWLSVLIVVGVHFLPLGAAFGPLCAGLGMLCISLASTGLMVRGVIGAETVILVDGTLKVLVGGVMTMYPAVGSWRPNMPG